MAIVYRRSDAWREGGFLDAAEVLGDSEEVIGAIGDNVMTFLIPILGEPIKQVRGSQPERTVYVTRSECLD